MVWWRYHLMSKASIGERTANEWCYEGGTFSCSPPRVGLVKLRHTLDKPYSTNMNAIPCAKTPSSSALHPVPGFSDSRAFAAAAERRTPIVGTGGTSLGMAMALGCLVVGSSGGSVATTNKSKVTSYAAGLAYHWGLMYKAGAALSLPLSPASIFGGCLPSFLGVLVARELFVALPRALGDDVTNWTGLTWNSLPIIAAAVAARQVSAMSDLATAAGELRCGIPLESPCQSMIFGETIEARQTEIPRILARTHEYRRVSLEQCAAVASMASA